jgi:hypothetical protein
LGGVAKFYKDIYGLASGQTELKAALGSKGPGLAPPKGPAILTEAQKAAAAKAKADMLLTQAQGAYGYSDLFHTSPLGVMDPLGAGNLSLKKLLGAA